MIVAEIVRIVLIIVVVPGVVRIVVLLVVVRVIGPGVVSMPELAIGAISTVPSLPEPACRFVLRRTALANVSSISLAGEVGVRDGVR